MKLGKILQLVAAVVLIATISISTSLAYITDTGSQTNVATVGNLKIELLEYERVDTETKDAEAIVQEFHNGKLLVPAVLKQSFDYTPGGANVDWTQIGKSGYSSSIWDPAKINNELDKMVFVKNSGNIGAYIRNYFAFEAGSYTEFDAFQSKIHLNLNETDWDWEWIPDIADIDGTKYFIASATYKKVLEAGKITEISLSQIALDSSANNEEVAAFGQEYTILVYTQGVQETGFDNSDDALQAGFGSDIPFDGVVIEKGLDLKTALHYLNGDNQGTAITANVTNVIFDLNEKYPDIVSNYEGTLISAEQDARVLAYYVPNGSNYDIYVLADGTIYTPKDSTGLFRDMTALTKVDTANMDVSRTENMKGMFRGCSNLTTVDVSGWDTGSVTDMNTMFHGCSKIDGLDVGKWDVSNVTNMAYMFDRCPSITSLNVTNWDVGKVTTFKQFLYNDTTNGLTSLDVSKWNTESATDMQFMFCGCMNLESLDVSGWDVSNVTTFKCFLQSSVSHHGGMKIKELKGIEKWDTSSATEMSWMFYGCSNLTELDLSAWDVSNVTTMYHMFADCMSLTTLNMKGWNTESLTNMNGIFNTCISLKVIDVSDFDTQNVTDMCQAFETCYALEEIIGLDKWDTSNVLYMAQMFSSPPGYNVSNHLKVLDLSSWDTSNVTHMSEMFQSSPDLVTIYVGDGWTTENVVDSTNMFKKCPSIVGEKGTTFDSKLFDMTYAHVDGGEENPGYFTYKGNANP